MKNFFLIFVTIISLTFLFSCSNDQEIKTKQVFVNPVDKTFYEQTTDTITTVAVSVKIKTGMTLSKLSKKCTGDWHNWKIIFDMNYNLLKNRLEYKIINGKSVPWVWIYPGEMLDLPSNYAKYSKQFIVVRGTYFKKKYVKTKENLYTIDPKKKEGGIPLLVKKTSKENKFIPLPITSRERITYPKNTHTPFWSTGLGNVLGNILWFLIWIVFVALLLLFLYWLFNQFQNMNSNGGGNTGGGENITEENEEDPCACDNITTRMQQISKISEDMGKAAGPNGHASLLLKDNDFELKLEFSKEKKMTEDEVRKIVEETLGDSHTEETIILIIERLQRFPEFENRDDLIDYLNRTFSGERTEKKE